ncbi:unnamed protein product [Sphagnum tenellum]
MDHKNMPPPFPPIPPIQFPNPPNDIPQGPRPTLSPREALIDEVKIYLGNEIIDLELDPKHYNFAVTHAFGRYRQRSGNALEESFLFLDVQPDVAIYTLPDEVQEVRSIYRRSIGGSAGGAAIDPFSLAWTNSIYMVQNPGGLGGSGAGQLATYDFAMQYQSLVGRMFGRDIMFTFDSALKRLTLHRRITNVEQIAVHIYNSRPESVLLMDAYARPWLRDWAVAVCKQIMGEARSKFGNIAGPQGGVSLNGTELKTEAKAEMERLDNEITQFVEQHIGYPFIVG